MNSFMKKSTATAMAVTMLSIASLSAPQKAHAIVGLAVPISGLAIAGAIVFSVSLMGLGCFEKDGAFFIPGLVTGFVMLDEKNGNQVIYQKLEAKSNQTLGITDAQRDVYNSELDRVNLIASTVTTELARMEKPTAEAAHGIWMSMADKLAPETQEVLSKVSLHSLKK